MGVEVPARELFGLGASGGLGQLRVGDAAVAGEAAAGRGGGDEDVLGEGVGEGLQPRQLLTKMRWDDELRRLVSGQDFKLLTRVSHQEFVKALVVYALIAMTFIIGVVAFVFVQTRPKPLALTDWHLESTDPEAKGLAVDLDDLNVTWKADGPPEDLTVSLENIDTRRRTSGRTVSSAQQYLVFPKGSYGDVLAYRERNNINRVRIVARGSRDSYASNEFALRVGIKVTAIPVPDDNAIWLAAMIDNASIPYYQYQAKLLVWPKKRSDGPLTYGDEMKNPKMQFIFPNLGNIDLNTIKIAYFGPDDPRIVRTGLIQ